ncbi:major facilitator superfamily domain-containing protein [Terfezia claveryi]|nr:major facilitator superfamily domain-containing protein [Terfezia claveryi]
MAGIEKVESAGHVLSKSKKTIIVLALCMCVLMAAMDQTIVTTAVPVIAQQFHSKSGYTWIGTAYLLPAAAFLPSWGKFSDIFGRKQVLLIAAGIFLVGSILCAASQGVTMIIVGRAVQGSGAGGLVGLVNVTISDLVPVRERGLYLAFVGFTWAFASAIGPILGGIFTQYVTWRLCFWINVPISVIAMTALYIFLHLETPTISLVEGVKRVDWVGSALIIGGTVLFLLGMEFGGVSHPWDSAIVLCFLILGLTIMAVFVIVEWKFAKLPIMPLRLFTNRTNIASYITAVFHGFVFIGGCYFLPLFFQAVRGYTVLMSGVSILPFVLVLSITAGVNGNIISKTGSYLEPIWVGCFLMVLGMGLFVDLNRTSNWGKITMYQIIAGAGCGPLFQGPLISIHSVISQRDVATATSTFAFLRNLATSIGISLGLVVFSNIMDQQIPTLRAKGVSEAALALLSHGGALANVPSIKDLPRFDGLAIRDAYAQGMKGMWWFFFTAAVVSGIASAFIGRHELQTTVKSNQPAKHKKKVIKEKKSQEDVEDKDVEKGAVEE